MIYNKYNNITSVSLAFYAQKFKLLPADRIKEPIFQTGLTQHHAIYLGMDDYGQEWISENHWKKGVRLIKASEYFKKNQQYSVVPFNGNFYQRIASVKRALLFLGRPYDLINFNCEHYANAVQYNRLYSRQVGNGIFAAFVLALVGIAFSK